VRGNLTALVGKDKGNINILMNMHSPPLEGNFCDEHGRAVKLATIQDSNRQVGCVDKLTACNMSFVNWNTAIAKVTLLFFLTNYSQF